MPRTLAQIRNSLRRSLADRDDLTDEDLTEYVNVGQRQVARERWPEMERTWTWRLVVDQDDYAYTDIDATVSLHELYTIQVKDDERWEKLDYVSPRLWDKTEYRDDITRTDRPYWYTVWERSISVRSTPKEAYEARAKVLIWPRNLVADGDTSQLRDKDDVILYLARAEAYGVVGNAEAAEFWETKARRRMAVARESRDNVSDYEPAPKWAQTSLGETPVSGREGPVGDYWIDPFVRSVR